MSKKTIIEKALHKATDAIYDADQIIGGIRTTKETAAPLRQVTEKMVEADRYITEAIGNLD
jgi:hypothetical protein